jgi:arylsulfatase A-like enzyme
MPAVAYSVSQGIRIFKDATAVHANVSRCYNDIQYAYSDACVWVDGPRKVFAQHVKRAYFACISYVDAQIGRIVDALKEHDLYDKTVISFNGDHVRDESSLPC